MGSGQSWRLIKKQLCEETNMSKIFKLLYVSTLPAAFIFAGSGLLWLYYFRLQDGGFYERLVTYATDWNSAHILLSLSAIMIFPAALAVRQLVGSKPGRVLAEIAAVMALFGGFFLGGQYVIDFIMPLIARAGGEAFTVHNEFFTDPWVNTMFYNLQDLGSISLLLGTIALFWSKTIDVKYFGILLVLWVAIIVGGIMDIPLLGRPAFIVLGLALIPVSRKLYQEMK